MASLQQTLAEAAMLARLVRDLPAFLRSPVSAEQAAEVIRRRLETRAERFLRLAERAIYRNPASPYLRLLRGVGCEPGDLRALVAREGLEGALADLARRGVGVNYDEMKGRRPIVRGSERFEATDADFDNPGRRPHLVRLTSGTRGAGSRIRITLDFIAEQAPIHALALRTNGFADADHAIWMTAPIFHLLRYARLGGSPVAWFYPIAPLPWKARALGRFLNAYGRLLGRPLPAPTHCDLRDPERIARWLAARRGGRRPVVLTAYASSAVRAALAARDLGLSLDGVGFVAIGEPFTDGKQRAIEAVAGRPLSYYGATETGTLAYRCPEARAADDVHLFADSFALVQQPRRVDPFGVSVDAFVVTTLLDSAPQIWLNVENGDHGLRRRRACGCAMGALGLTDHLSEIRSHEKLTGEGMSFVATEISRVLDEVLPARFGGSLDDYQILEEEDGAGISRLFLLVSPGVGPLDEAELKRAFLAELGRGGEAQRYMAGVWARAQTVEVRRRLPVATRSGKVLPFHLVRSRV